LILTSCKVRFFWYLIGLNTKTFCSFAVVILFNKKGFALFRTVNDEVPTLLCHG
jgi:hypothetical protein